MAQKVEVLFMCDLHEEEVEAAETIAFGLDGSAFEVDACDEHAAALRDAFAPFVGAARRAGRPAAAATAHRSRSTGRAAGRDDKERVQEIREWGRAQGFAVSGRGRLSGQLTAAYEAAH